MCKQLIIVRKDLNMYPGKLSAQVAHASMAFLTCDIRVYSTDARYEMLPVTDTPYMYRHPKLYDLAMEAQKKGEKYFRLDTPENNYFRCNMKIDADLYDNWLNGSFTKIICEAKNRNYLMKAIEMAKSMGMYSIKRDFFLIEDNCRTELKPETFDKDGIGRCLTCIGFRPMPEEIIDKIGKKYQLYK